MAVFQPLQRPQAENQGLAGAGRAAEKHPGLVLVQRVHLVRVQDDLHEAVSRFGHSVPFGSEAEWRNVQTEYLDSGRWAGEPVGTNVRIDSSRCTYGLWGILFQ